MYYYLYIHVLYIHVHVVHVCMYGTAVVTLYMYVMYVCTCKYRDPTWVPTCTLNVLALSTIIHEASHT